MRIAAAAALLACAGCGFKGALYLPERNATVVTHPAKAAQGAQSPGQTQSPAKGKSKMATTLPQTAPPQNPPAQSPPPPPPSSQ
ncbi:MAG TPA: lipoprotein [Steroidobacteraceae bacterium]|nr:lipoprotein [Steroidobacteraceae bacterium]